MLRYAMMKSLDRIEPHDDDGGSGEKEEDEVNDEYGLQSFHLIVFIALEL